MKKPSEHFRRPVLGRITAQLVLIDEQGREVRYPPDTYEFIGRQELPGGEVFYVCDAWHEPGQVQVVPGAAVVEVEWYPEPPSLGGSRSVPS